MGGRTAFGCHTSLESLFDNDESTVTRRSHGHSTHRGSRDLPTSISTHVCGILGLLLRAFRSQVTSMINAKLLSFFAELWPTHLCLIGTTQVNYVVYFRPNTEHSSFPQLFLLPSSSPDPDPDDTRCCHNSSVTVLYDWKCILQCTVL